MGSVGKTAPTIERGRRCQNCVHFNNGQMATSHYKACRDRDLKAAAERVLSGAGVSAALRGQRLGDDDPHTPRAPRRDMSAQEKMDALGLNYELGDQLIRTGQLGICLISAAPGDFVHHAYLCDRWKERVKPEGADDKNDELPEEARERIFGSDK